MTSPQYAIVGLGSVIGPHQEYSGRALQAEAARRAIVDAGLKPSQIDGALDLRRIITMGIRPYYTDAFPRVLGLPVNFYQAAGRGGSQAGFGIATAIGFLTIGAADYIVCSGYVEDWSRSQRAKAEGRRGTAHPFETEGYWGKSVGAINAASCHSLFATRHMHEFGTTSAQFGAIAVAQREWANLNPDAKMYGRPMTLEDHQNSPLVVEPYRLLDFCQVSDGAVAFVITTADRAQDTRDPIMVMGVGFGEHMGRLWWEKGNYTRLAVESAKTNAFRKAGITVDDLDFAQLYDCFTGEVLLQVEDYGWCKKGEGGPFVEEGNTRIGGKIPVNTGGGLLSAYHYGDLTGLLEAIIQLRGAAGARQVKDARIGLVTGHGGEILGPGMCSVHSTLVLGR